MGKVSRPGCQNKVLSCLVLSCLCKDENNEDDHEGINIDDFVKNYLKGDIILTLLLLSDNNPNDIVDEIIKKLYEKYRDVQSKQQHV